MRKKFLSCFLFTSILLQGSGLSAQNSLSEVKSMVLKNTFIDYGKSKRITPKPASFKKKSLFARVNPVNYFSSGLLFLYQSALSEQVQAECNYEISCSNYTKVCIEKFGLLKGVLLGFDQLNSCTQMEIYDYPRYKISPRYKIINRFEE